MRRLFEEVLDVFVVVILSVRLDLQTNAVEVCVLLPVHNQQFETSLMQLLVQFLNEIARGYEHLEQL